MTLQSSGQISMYNLNVELDRSGTTGITLNDSDVRSLANTPSGQISLSNFYGKSNVGNNWSTVVSTALTLKGVTTDSAGNWTSTSTTGYAPYSTDNGVSWVTTLRPTTVATWGCAYLAGGFLSNQDGNTRVIRTTSVSVGGGTIYNSGQSLRNSQSNDGYFIQGANNGVTYASSNGTTYVTQPAIGANSAYNGIYVAALNRTVALGAVAGQSKYRNGVPSSAAWTGSCTGLGTGALYNAAWSSALGVCVVVGTLGLYYSTNLINFTQATNPTGQAMYGVCWSATSSQFIAVGAAGAVVTSKGGVNWTARTSGTSAVLYDVDASNGVAVAVGAGVILKSQ